MVCSDKQVIPHELQRAASIRPLSEALVSRAATEIVNFVAALMCHLGVKTGCGSMAVPGGLNKCQGPQVLGVIPNTSTFLISGRLKMSNIVLFPASSCW